MEESKEPREKLSGYLDVWHNYFLPEYGLQCLKIRLWSTSLSLHLKLHSLLALFFVKNHLRIIAQVKIVFQNVKRNAESFPLNLTLSQLQPKSTLFYVTVNFAEPLLLSFHKDVQKYNLFLYSPIRKKKKKNLKWNSIFLRHQFLPLSWRFIRLLFPFYSVKQTSVFSVLLTSECTIGSRKVW